MSDCLVTGGGGFIGSHIVRRLLELGHSVRVLDNFSTGSRENLADLSGRIELVEGDVRDLETAKQAAEGAAWIFHQAAIPSVPRSLAKPLETSAANVMGTVAMLEAARQAGARRFIYAASSSAYGDQPVERKIETLPTNPLSPYAAAKLAGEEFCKAYHRSFGLHTVCLRYFNVFGPRQSPDSPYSAVIPRFIRAGLEGRPPEIYGDGRQSRDFTYVDNAVHANLLAAQSGNGAGETINAACGGSYSLLELLERLSAILGHKISPAFAPPRAGDVRHSLASIDKARELLGYEVIVDLDEGLRRTVESLRRRPPGA